MIAFQNIGGCDPRIMAGNRRQRRPASCRITGCIDKRVRNALQIFIQQKPFVFDGDAGRGEIEVCDVGNTPRGMHNKVGLQDRLPFRCLRVHTVRVAGTLDRIHFASGVHIDPDFFKFLHKPFNNVGVEMRKHALPALKHCHLRSRARSDVRKFGGDVATADHDDPRGPALQLHERIAGDQMFRARNGNKRR